MPQVACSQLVVHDVLEHWVAGAHQVVEDATSLHNHSHSFRVILHGRKQDLEPVGQDAECVLHDLSCSGQPVVVDALFMAEVSVAIRH